MKVIEMPESFAGEHISSVCKEAVRRANGEQALVVFSFNGTQVRVTPGETPDQVQRRWDEDREAAHQEWINSPEYKKQEEEREERTRKEREAVMICSAKDEKEMRDASVPWPKTEKQLCQYIESLVKRQHDYGTCVYAMSMAAVAAFYYVSGRLGVTGFQASCADLDVLRRTRNLAGPFIVLKGEDTLYPQYDLQQKLAEAMESWKPWIKEQAQKMITEARTHTHPDVLNHWRRLSAMKVKTDARDEAV
jgi:hypothetical protein